MRQEKETLTQQLLNTIKQKVTLSQELEAWQVGAQYPDLPVVLLNRPDPPAFLRPLPRRTCGRWSVSRWRSMMSPGRKEMAPLDSRGVNPCGWKKTRGKTSFLSSKTFNKTGGGAVSPPLLGSAAGHHSLMSASAALDYIFTWIYMFRIFKWSQTLHQRCSVFTAVKLRRTSSCRRCNAVVNFYPPLCGRISRAGLKLSAFIRPNMLAGQSYLFSYC